MSRVIAGYLDGRPIWRDEGPAFAHHQGYGGELVTGHTTTQRSQSEASMEARAQQRAGKLDAVAQQRKSSLDYYYRNHQDILERRRQRYAARKAA